MKHPGTGRGLAVGLLIVNSWVSAASLEESGTKRGKQRHGLPCKTVKHNAATPNSQVNNRNLILG